MQGAAAGGRVVVGKGAERQPQASLVFGKCATLGSLPVHAPADHHRARPATAAALLATPYDAWPDAELRRLTTPGAGGSELPRQASASTRPSTVAAHESRFGQRPHTSTSSTARRPATVDAATGRLVTAPLCAPASGEAMVCSASTSRLLSSWQERARGQLEAQALAVSAARSAGPTGPLRAACTHNGGWAKGGAVATAVKAAALVGAWSKDAKTTATAAAAKAAAAAAKLEAAGPKSPPQRPRWGPPPPSTPAAEGEATAAEAKSPLAPSSRPMSSGFALEARPSTRTLTTDRDPIPNHDPDPNPDPNPNPDH